MLWPAPQIGDVDPYSDLGVGRSQLAERYTAGAQRVSPYVDRDIDQTARKRLQSHGAVLLVGTPASGVTRTAYHLALTVPTSTRVLVPQTPQGLTTALGDLDVLARLASETRLLLWLDRVETFTKAGLIAAMLRRCRERAPGLRVVATISSTRYEVWATENPSVAEAFGDPVVLERLPSEKELGRAEAAYPGVDFSEGIAAAFTITATLLKRLHGGDHSCRYEPAGDDCALSRVIVEIVLEWTCTDICRPLPVDRLSALAQQRLGGRQGIEPTHLAGALQWAASPIVGGASLLFLTTDCHSEQAVAAHPAMVEIRRAEAQGPAEAVWTAALEAAAMANDSEAVGRIGFRGHTDGNMSTAARAWAMITAIDDPATQWVRHAAALSRRRGEYTAAIPPLRRLPSSPKPPTGPTTPRSQPPSPIWGPRGPRWGSRPRPATCLSGRCASTSGSSAPTTPRSHPSSPIWGARGRSWGSRPPPASSASGRCGSMSGSSAPTTPRSQPPSPFWGAASLHWGSRPRPASSAGGRCNRTSGSSAPTTPRSPPILTILGIAWQKLGAAGQGPRAA